MRMYPRHRLDISAGDILFALAAGVVARRPGALAARIARDWAPAGDGMACFSVRTALDVLLSALEFAPGDEIVASAVTHPHMVRIIERHGLRAVPVDLDLETLAPRRDLLERAVGERTRAIMVAHLFGARVDLAAVTQLAEQRGLLVIEDCAQTIAGPHDTGDARTDVSLFSFGSIKTATALGGALVRVRDAELLSRMREAERAFLVQPRREYTAKVLKYLGLIMLSNPTVYGLFVRGTRSLGKDFDRVVNRSVRAVDAGGDEALLAWLRRRPSAPLLALLRRRLRRFPAERLQRRAKAGDELARSLPPTLFHPGAAVGGRTHWVFPVVADEPERLIRELRREGFDATTGTSAIAVVDAPSNRSELDAQEARRLMEGIVFLPAYPEVPSAERERLSRTLASLGAPPARERARVAAT
jgi:perosamine synthetase